MKFKSVVVSVALATALLAGCGAKEAEEKKEVQTPPAAQEQKAEQVDVVTTASLVNEEAAFLKAISKDGTWIVCTLEDMKIDKELVLEGEFHNKNDAAQPLYRKLALYAQDADHKVTARYTLTAPKLTIKSPNAKIQGGTFKGDVYVEANGFIVQDAKIEGNVYFANEEFKSTFKTEKEGTVTGTTEVKQ
ncbi:hypothetical protein [Petroclostridium sp. X23]|uniref:hypothetical protein n=1 Tax=Petroclostridium sp. X23 TaxID=3045146 RepID=UPI0024ACDBF0|nr:hypothetical protein [Petroclostridium sp. X23]WHH59564.1 hypothetical protein QKW49_02025 [Petroclostridium sp. X23]